MTNIELYINRRLCDIQSPEKLGVRLNRVLINPAELSTKDAQYSYSITIPTTPGNDEIFGYANVEEVKNKFNRHYTAQLYVDSVRVFDGRFKLSEIDSAGNYKGNLVVPAKKTIKEIFGEKKMTEMEGILEADFTNTDNVNEPLTVTEMLNKYNADKGTPNCIFPLVLYGLLPKVSKNVENEFTAKAIWDKYVRLGIQDFPPSINCMKVIEHIFANSKNDRGEPYSIGGTALEDPRLKNLYMSYQNPTTYNQEWNWATVGRFRIEGSWTNYKKVNNVNTFEKYFYMHDVEQGSESPHSDIYTANLFQGSMIDLKRVQDYGTNVIVSETEDSTKKAVRKNVHITIPQSGLYKINLDVNLTLRMSDGKSYVKDENEKVYVIGENNHITTGRDTKLNNFANSRYEVKLLRDFGNGFNITDIKHDGFLYKNNLPQVKDQQESLYFPMPGYSCVQMVDPLQNEQLVGGFRWGDPGISRLEKTTDGFFLPGFSIPNGYSIKTYNTVYNLAEGLFDKLYPAHSRILSIKNGWSWDKTYSQKNKIYSAINSEGYAKKIGKNAEEENTEEENSTTDGAAPKGWERSSKFKVDLSGVNRSNYINNIGNTAGKGYLNQVIWLEKGEHLTLVTVSDEGHRSSGSQHGWMVYDVDFVLDVQPFKSSFDWITVDSKGTGTKEMKWNDSSDFSANKMNLVKFLPSELKIDEWLDNFCKAFNLDLIQPEEGKFELNVKQTRSTASAASVIDLDGKANIAQRTNQPLGLPSEYRLGFKVNQEEEGYVFSKKENGDVAQDGGGSFVTGSIDGAVVTQTSNFSYNWFKKITKENVVGRNSEGKDIITTQVLELPIITHSEIWKNADPKDYAEMLKKLYTNYAQRFWYKTDNPDNVGVVWNNTDKKTQLLLPHLSNRLDQKDTLSLDYNSSSDSILGTYFSIIATDDSNYTYVECYLTPDEYERMDGCTLLKFNGDLYYIAAVEGYDPMGWNKTKLKLIRRV